MTELAIHEDAWGMIDLVPAENHAPSGAAMREATAHAEAHRAAGGVGWTAMYEVPPPQVGIRERALTVDAVARLVGPAWRRADRVTSGYASSFEVIASAFALTDGHAWLYGTVDGACIAQLCVHRPSPASEGALVALGRAHRLIANDWHQNAVVALDDELAVRRWLTDD